MLAATMYLITSQFKPMRSSLIPVSCAGQLAVLAVKKAGSLLYIKPHPTVHVSLTWQD